MKQKICMLMGTLLLLGGCKNGAPDPTQMVETQSTVSGDYGAALPFRSSDARQKHLVMARSLEDSMYISTGLLDLSKKHVSVSDHVFQEGQFLDYDILDASDLTTGLLGRRSDNNPIGLNPALDTQFDSGNGMITAPLILHDIYEIDFLKAQEVKAVSLAVVLNPKQGSVTIRDDKLLEYGSTAADEIVETLQSREGFPEGTMIYVTLYKSSASDDALPGAFFAERNYNSSNRFSMIDQQWVMFPGSTASALDNVTLQQFNSIADAIHNFLVEDVDMICKGRFDDGLFTELRITINMRAKTGSEATALTQYIKTLLNNFTSFEFRIRVEIKCNGENVALMERERGDSDVNVIMFI